MRKRWGEQFGSPLNNLTMNKLILLIFLFPSFLFAQDQDFEFVTSPELINFNDKGYDVGVINEEWDEGFEVEKTKSLVVITNDNYRVQFRVQFMNRKGYELIYKVIGTGYLVFNIYNETVKYYSDNWLLKTQYGL